MSLYIREGEDYPDVDEDLLPYYPRGILGSGTYSVVELVEDQNTGMVYARKTLKPAGRNLPLLRQEFQNEVENIRSVQQHHHMVKVHATYTTHRKFALLLSPVASDGDLDGFLGELSTLKDHPQRNPERLQDMTRIVMQAPGCLAAGLAFLRMNDIRHKDIKPGNILVHHGRVLYTDFGLSFNASSFDNSATDGPTFKSKRFAAPEVHSNGRKDSKSDVFSLACVYIEILVAITREYYGESNTIYMGIMPIVRGSILHNTSHQALRTAIVMMTAYDPGARSTALEVWQHFLATSTMFCRSCQRHTSPPDPPRGLHYMPWIWSERHENYFTRLVDAKYKFVESSPNKFWRNLC